MRPGDALYLPRGWLHSAVARAGTSIHLTIGVANFTGADVVRELTAAVAGADDLRTPLPIMGSAAPGGLGGLGSGRGRGDGGRGGHLPGLY